ASRDAESVVNPTRSAKRTETSRRSAAAGWRVGPVDTRSGRVRDGSVSDVPHSPQKRMEESFEVPHDGQISASGAPHVPQNLRPGGLSVPPLEHITGSPPESPPPDPERRRGAGATAEPPSEPHGVRLEKLRGPATRKGLDDREELLNFPDVVQVERSLDTMDIGLLDGLVRYGDSIAST